MTYVQDNNGGNIRGNQVNDANVAQFDMPINFGSQTDGGTQVARLKHRRSSMGSTSKYSRKRYCSIIPLSPLRGF